MLFILSIAFAQAADDEVKPDVRKLMAPEDFKASGLDKLTDAERAHLSDWVGRYREGAISGPPVAPKPMSEQTEEEKVVTKEKREARKNLEIVAKVVPRFRGWSGKSIFRLDNGQVYQQRMAGSLRYDGDDSTVIISRNLMGKYKMKHQGTGRTIGVKRID
jgi:hypothetical protein